MTSAANHQRLTCVILAGGLGTRMRAVAADMPKALIPVRGAGGVTRPFAHHQLQLLAGQGVTDVVYSVGYKGEMIRAAVGDGAAFGLRVSYVDEGTQLRGTGGALRLCLDQGKIQDWSLVLYGDSYLPIDLAPVVQAFHRQRQAGRPALMTVLHNEGRWDRSNVIFRAEEGAAGQVVLYDKSAQKEGGDRRMMYIDYGLTALTAEVAGRLPAGEVCDLAGLYRDLSLAGQLGGYEVSRRFYEIGSPEGLRDLEALLGQGEDRP